MPASDANFGPRLRELRGAAGLTQAGLAVAAGLAKTTVTSLEQGLYDASWPTVRALCGALGVECTAFTERAGSAGSSSSDRAKKRAERSPAKGRNRRQRN
jgi:DNA-binding XRE family transcriptional regulator